MTVFGHQTALEHRNEVVIGWDVEEWRENIARLKERAPRALTRVVCGLEGWSR